MELRLIVAYGLMALIVLFVTGLALWLRHNARDRTVARNRLRDNKAFERRSAGHQPGEG